MNNWVTKIWLLSLLLAFAVALFFEFGSVETLDLDSGHSPPALSGSQQMKPSPRRQVAPKSKSHLAVGERYASLNELVADQEAAGFVRTGYFGKFWPATVAEIATDRDGISFVRQNGTKHNYTKFDGYNMKMVRLRAGNKETIVVFRSLSKR